MPTVLADPRPILTSRSVIGAALSESFSVMTHVREAHNDVDITVVGDTASVDSVAGEVVARRARWKG